MMSAIDQCLAQHEELREIGTSLMVELRAAEPDQAEIGLLRWRLCRIYILHRAFEQQAVFTPLMSKKGGSADLSVRRAERQAAGMEEEVRSYMIEWPATRISTEWQSFGRVTRELVGRLCSLLRAEETMVFDRLSGCGTGAGERLAG